LKKCGTDFVFEGSTIEAAAHGESCPRQNGPQAAQLLFDSSHVGDAKGAQVQYRSRVVGNDVGACSAGDQPYVYGNAARQVISTF